MEIEDIQAFIEVANAGGLTPAARRLGVAKSAVSRSLRRLETELGAQLLARTTRGASLTEAGASFRDHAIRIAAELEAARDAISPEGHLRGRLNVAAPLSFGANFFAPLLAELARRHPALEIRASYSDRNVDLVNEGFDAAIRLGRLRDSTLVARRIVPLGGKIVASPVYLETHSPPRTPDDLASHEAVAQFNEVWHLRDGERVVTVHPHGRFRADNGEALVPAVLAGIGIAMLPNFLIASHVASGALVELMPEYPMVEAGMYVVRPPGGHAPRKVRALIDILLEKFGDARGC